jgi:hypothetical protein
LVRDFYDFIAIVHRVRTGVDFALRTPGQSLPGSHKSNVGLE